MDPAGRVALVTGAGHRVGRAIALALGAAGARMAVHFNTSADGARRTVEEIRSAGGEAQEFQADLRHPGSPAALMDAVRGRFAALHILVNSAAVMVRTPLDEITAETWDDMFALNLRAPFFCAVEASRLMRAEDNTAAVERLGQKGVARERGVIINIADLAGLESWSGYIPHGISKAGVLHMTRSLARVLAPDIRVNAIAPGTVLLPDDWDAEAARRLERTTPLGRHGSPDDVSQAALYLLRASYVTGETLIVDGGRHVR